MFNIPEGFADMTPEEQQAWFAEQTAAQVAEAAKAAYEKGLNTKKPKKVKAARPVFDLYEVLETCEFQFTNVAFLVALRATLWRTCIIYARDGLAQKHDGRLWNSVKAVSSLAMCRILESVIMSRKNGSHEVASFRARENKKSTEDQELTENPLYRLHLAIEYVREHKPEILDSLPSVWLDSGVDGEASQTFTIDRLALYDDTMEEVRLQAIDLA